MISGIVKTSIRGCAARTIRTTRLWTPAPYLAGPPPPFVVGAVMVGPAREEQAPGPDRLATGRALRAAASRGSAAERHGRGLRARHRDEHVVRGRAGVARERIPAGGYSRLVEREAALGDGDVVERLVVRGRAADRDVAGRAH